MTYAAHFRNYGSEQALIWRMAAASVSVRAAVIRNLIAVRAYDPDQPRVPRGYRYGGRWVGEGDDFGPPAADDRSPSPMLLASLGDDFPEIPDQRPQRARERYSLAQRIARWLLDTNNTTRAAYYLSLVGGFIDAAGHDIVSYFDEPKSLEELREAADHPQTGYDIHHIVEQTPARRDGFSDKQINSRDNRARIPRFRHWEINAWYGRPNKDFGGLSPRDYLRGRDWETRMSIGIDALREHGVLLP